MFIDPQVIIELEKNLLDIRVFVTGVITLELGVLLWFLAGIRRATKRERKTNIREAPFISVVIPARNEEESLPGLLDSLTKQKIDKDRWEVLIINDQSQDRTKEIALSYQDRIPGLRVIDVQHTLPHLSGKQNALHLGFENAKGDLVVCTDADCRVSETWLETYSEYYQKGYRFIAGPTWEIPDFDHKKKPDSLPGALLVIVHAWARALFGHKIPILSQGTNLACDRQTYFETGGYPQFDGTTADDCQLMQAVYKLYPDDVIYTNNRKIMNISYRKMNLKEQLLQIIRWVRSGSPKTLKNYLMVIFAVSLIYANLVIPLLAMYGYFSVLYAVIYILSWIFLFVFMLWFGQDVILGDMDFIECFYYGILLYLVFFIVAAVVLGHISTPTWKDRRVPV